VSARRYIGVDPGPTPGIVALDLEERRVRKVCVIQCSASALDLVLWALLCDASGPCVLQVERFVTRGRANAAQSLTRDQVGEVLNQARRHMDATVVQRSASQVKPWATDERLKEAGLLEACKGMRHARDAARHALFAAVHDGALPDPLSKEWKSR